MNLPGRRTVARLRAAPPGTVMRSVGILLLGGCALVTVTYTVIEEQEDNRELDRALDANAELQAEVTILSEELRCRTSAAQAANSIESRMTETIGFGLAALASDNDTEFLAATERLTELSRALGPALDEREAAVATCEDAAAEDRAERNGG